MRQLGSRLLEDEGAVGVVYQPVEQLLRVAQEEAVGIVVELSNLLLDAAEQPQFVEVAQRHVGRNHHLPLSLPAGFSLLKQGDELFVGQSYDLLPVRTGLRAPFLGVVEALGECLRHALLVAPVLAAQLVEVGGDTTCAALQVGWCEALRLQHMLEPVGIARHLLDGACTDIAQRLGIATEEALFLQLCVQSFARRLIVVAEDGLSESLDLSDDVPRLVVFDVLLDVADNPSEHLVVSRQLFYHLVDGLLFHLVVVQPDAQVGSELQFAGEVAKDGLEEGVDGHHAKLTIVVHHEGQGFRGLLGGGLSGDMQVVDDLFEIVLRVVQSVGDAVEL